MSNDMKAKARLWAVQASVNKMVLDNQRDADEVADYMQRIIDQNLPPVEPVLCFTEKDGIIRFDVIAPGWTGPKWEKFHDACGHKLSDDARKFLNSPDFKPTPKGTVLHVAVLKGELFDDSARDTENVRAKARKLKFKDAPHDLACIIRKEFTNEEIEKMGLWAIIGMSDTIDISNGGPRLLGAIRFDGKPWLITYCGKPGFGWNRDFGFAFLSPAS